MRSPLRPTLSLLLLATGGVGGLSFPLRTSPPLKHHRAASPPMILDMMEMCVEDYECDAPKRCCTGLFFDYCCDVGGLAQRVPRRNVTYPGAYPSPLPA